MNHGIKNFNVSRRKLNYKKDAVCYKRKSKGRCFWRVENCGCRSTRIRKPDR